MATKQEKLTLYIEELNNLIPNPDLNLLEKIVDLLWPSIFNKDSETVACSDEKELENVLESNVIKKLDLSITINDIKQVCEQMWTSNKNKYRAIFYYLLATK